MYYSYQVDSGLVLNCILIWLLAPTVRASSASTPLITTQLSLLPANIFAEGCYTLNQRLAAGLYKGILFGLCGFMGSVGGTSLAYLVFLLRRITNPSSAKDGKELPNVLENSLGWASFMFISTNPRYQLVNGIERVSLSTNAHGLVTLWIRLCALFYVFKQPQFHIIFSHIERLRL
jgi:hypothetical protein